MENFKLIIANNSYLFNKVFYYHLIWYNSSVRKKIMYSKTQKSTVFTKKRVPHRVLANQGEDHNKRVPVTAPLQKEQQCCRPDSILLTSKIHKFFFSLLFLDAQLATSRRAGNSTQWPPLWGSQAKKWAQWNTSIVHAAGEHQNNGQIICICCYPLLPEPKSRF